MPLFEVAVIESPTEKQIEDGTGSEKLLLAPTPVVAPDGQSAAIKAVMAATPVISLTDRTQVIVRPFA